MASGKIGTMKTKLIFLGALLLVASPLRGTSVNTAAGGMVQWTEGRMDLTQTNVWADVPRLNQSIQVDARSLWRVHANVRYRFIPMQNGDYCSVRLRLVVDGREVNVVGVVFNPPGTEGMEEINQHQTVEAVIELAPGSHTLNTQVLKWQGAPNSHIDVFADGNGYGFLVWQKIADLDASGTASKPRTPVSPGGMARWTEGQVVLAQTNAWYDVPKLSQKIQVDARSLWRVHANVRYRFIPIQNGDYCSVRLRLLVDGREVNVVGVVFNPPGTAGMEEVNQHQDIEAVVELAPGEHTVGAQALKWQDAASSHIDVFADGNGYGSLVWQKIGNL
jgi:hypothetical protein